MDTQYSVWCFSEFNNMIMSVDEKVSATLAGMYPGTIYFFAEIVTQ